MAWQLHTQTVLWMLQKKNKDTAFIINNLDIKAASYNNLKQYNEAKLIYEDIILIGPENLIPSHILRNISETYYHFENYERSIKYGLMAYRRALKDQLKNQIENSSFILSKSYEKTNNYKKAYKFSVISKNSYHDLFNEKKNAQFAELIAKYESKEKEQEIENQKEINKYNKLSLIQKQNENILLIVGIILVVLILLYISRQRKKTKKANTQLGVKNNEIYSKSKKLNELNEHLVKLGRFKEAMTGMIVHDLKNPLNIIINSDNIVYSKHAGRHMLMMVQNILDIQRFEEARLDINLNNESIYSLSQKAIKQVSLLVETKKIKVINNISKTYGVIADAEKTKRIFVNILTNAIKYTDTRGSITLNCEIIDAGSKAENENSGIPLYKVSITDTGEGIPSNKLDVIFDMFEQVEARNSGEIHSTGIGLTYCKLAVEAQGGSIWVESELNKGSKFWFTIPKGEDINMVLPEVEHTKIEIKLLPSDKQYLSPFIEALKELEVYDISEAEKILSKIDISTSVGIAEWKKIMKNTLFITDEDIFAELLNL